MQIGARITFITGVLLFLFHIYTSAQLDYLSIQNITHKEGLSNNYVNCIEQDKSGFIWIGTNDGLNRYDGYKMKTYYNAPGDSTSIPDNKITALKVDNEGILWVGTEASSLCRYNSIDDNFIRYKSAIHSSSKLNHHFVTDIITDSKGELWVSTPEGLNLYNKNSDSFKQINFGLQYEIDDESIYKLKKHNISNNAMSVALELQYKVFKSTKSFTAAIHNSVKQSIEKNEVETLIKCANKLIPDSLKHYNRFRSMAPDNDGHIWLLYDNSGFARFNTETREIQRYTIYPEISSSPQANTITSIIVNDNYLWLGTFNNGVYIFSKNDKSIKKIFHKNMQGALAMERFENNIMFFSEQVLHLYNESATINSQDAYPQTKTIPEITFNVRYILKDHSNNFWIASEGEGVFIMYQNKKFNLLSNSNKSKIELSKREVASLTSDNQNNVYVGYYRNNIDRINLVNFSHKILRNDAHYPNNTAPGSVLELSTDKYNNVWAGSYYAGLQKLHTGSNIFSFIESNDITDIRGIAFDSKDNVWAVVHGKGLYKFNKDGKLLKHWQANYEQWQSNLSDNWLNDICIDKNDNVYVASNQGISITNINGDVFKSYRNNPNNSKSLSHNTCVNIYCTNDNQVWIGTGNGLNYFNIKTEEFTQISMLNGLANNNINSVIDDHRGNIWVGTNSGLSRLIIDYNNGITLHRVENYDIHDGIPGEFYPKAVTKTNDGNLFFGGKNGLSWFHPDSIKPNMIVLKVVISDIKLFNESIFDKTSGYRELRQNYLKNSEITLNYAQNSIGLEFTALSYIQNPKNQYSCMLEGFDKNWQNIGNSHKVNYTNLEPGKYIFKIKAFNSDGISRDNPTTLRINILPPFWKSTLGYLIIYSILIIILGFVYFTVRTRLILINRIKMRKMEAQNLRELDKSKSSFFTNITHEFRTPITLIQGPIKKLLNSNFDSLDKYELKMQLKLVNRNADLLLRLVNQILDFKKADAGKLKYKPIYGNIIPFVMNIAETFNNLANEKNIKFSTKSNVPKLFMLFAPEKLEKVIYNLLSNAFKYTLESGQVDLLLEFNKNSDQWNEPTVRIAISDTGIGISNNNLENIFKLYYQADNAAKFGASGTGVGLFMVKTYTELHGGKVHISSNLNKGSTFAIEIPAKTNSSFEETFDHTNNSPKEYQFDIAQTKNADNKLKILIVEDNVDILFFLKNELDEYFNIESANNGLEAYKLLKNTLPDLILSDIMMPVMDGYEFCHKVKNNLNYSHIPVILLSAKISNDDKLKGYEVGAEDYITKPFDPKILLVKIQRILESRLRVQNKVSESTGVIPKELENKNTAESSFLEGLFEILEKNLDNAELDVEYLSKQLGMSRTLMYEKINILTGQPVADYIKTYRLNRAAQMLKDGESIVSEIVWKVGFKSHAHFTRAFKQKFGCAPSKYLNK